MGTSPRPLVISHAACGGHAPENTLAGVRAALALGVDAIEIDVHASADGVPVVIHDASVDRTTDGRGLVRELSFAKLRHLDAGRLGFDGRFDGERIPSLAEVAGLTTGHCRLIVEIKQPGIARRVIEVLRGAGATGSAMIWSFDLETVAQARLLEPGLPAALLTPPVATQLPLLLDGAVERRLTGASIHHRIVTAETVQAAHERGLTVYAWTADEPAEQRRLRDCGVDGIVTNVPDVLSATLVSA